MRIMRTIVLMLLFMQIITFAQVASDAASNYGGSWSNGNNQGSGFGAWSLTTTGTTGFAGFFIGNGAGDGFGDLDGTTTDFGMYGNSGDKYANAARDFSSTLANNNTFRIDLAIAYRNGNKGIDIKQGSNTPFTFFVSGDKYQYQINGGSAVDLGWSYAQGSIFRVEVMQSSITDIIVKVSRISGGTATFGPQTISVSGRVSGFKLFIGTTEGASLNNLYANNLEIRNNSPLPVELTSFSARTVGSLVKLSWATATETNNYGFEVERKSSTDAVWTKVGFVKGNGNSNTPRDYSYTDKSANAGKYLYRLKQVDNGGASEFSKQVEVNLLTVPGTFTLEQNYPNPFNPSTSIKFGFADNTKASLKVYNVLGKEVADLFNGIAEAGKYYSVVFDARELSSGIYYYKLVSPGRQEMRKMIYIK